MYVCMYVYRNSHTCSHRSSNAKKNVTHDLNRLLRVFTNTFLHQIVKNRFSTIIADSYICMWIFSRLMGLLSSIVVYGSSVLSTTNRNNDEETSH